MKELSKLTDNELIGLYRSGQTRAFDALIFRHKHAIYTCIFLLTRDRFLAEDLFQDIFIKVIHAISNGNYSERDKFLPWALRIAHNFCFDHFRKVKRSPKITTTEGVDIYEAFNILSENIEDEIALSNRHKYILSLLQDLPDLQREVIIYRHYGNLSFKEIAEITQSREVTIRGRMRYGLARIRKMMLQSEIGGVER